MLAKDLQIHIKGNTEASLAEIMQAYLLFYLHGSCAVELSDTHINILHPLAKQVMLEDGIDISETHKITLAGSLLTKICISYEQMNTDIFMTIHISDPLVASSYDTILENFRTVREELKKTSIEIAGKILQYA